MNGYDIIILVGGAAIAAVKTDEIDGECELVEKSGPNTGDWRLYDVGKKQWGFSTGFLITSAATLATRVLQIGNTYTVNIKQRGANTNVLTGSAICQQCKVTAARGSLLEGSFAFVGNGELQTPPSS